MLIGAVVEGPVHLVHVNKIGCGAQLKMRPRLVATGYQDNNHAGPAPSISSRTSSLRLGEHTLLLGASENHLRAQYLLDIVPEYANTSA